MADTGASYVSSYLEFFLGNPTYFLAIAYELTKIDLDICGKIISCY